MKMMEVKERARCLGIKAGKMKKHELIHAIQESEGNQPCFGKSNGQCSYKNCCFIDDCLSFKS